MREAISQPRLSGDTAIECAPARNLFGRAIDEFLCGLAEKEKNNAKNRFIQELVILASQNDSTGRGNGVDVSAKELQAFVVDLESERHSGRAYRILTRLSPFLEALKNLLRLCESFGQGSPLGVGAAFSGARIVLELAISHHTYFDIIVNAMERIGDYLACYQRFGEAFDSSLDFQDRLIRSYKRVLEFWYKVSQNLSHRKLVFKSITVSLIEDTREALDGLKEDCRHIQGFAQATESLQAKKTREDDLLHDIRSWIMAGFGYVDVRIDQERESARRQEGTCEWIFEDERFINWRDNTRENSVLWYNAVPGAGKTVMASAIVEHLKSRGDSVAWWYFSFNNPKQRLAMSSMRSLALQLLTILDYVPDELEAVFRQELRQHAMQLEALTVASTAIHKLINQCSHVHIVIDGIDECFDEMNLLSSLLGLVQKETRGLVKWLFTSRDHLNIRAAMQQVSAVEVVPDQDAMLKDVQAYFTANLSLTGDMTKHTQGEDNFLYATFICETLRGEGFTCDAEIEDALEKFPKDLITYYTRALEKIALETEEKQELARRVFTLVVGSMQPITLDEAMDALAIRLGAKDYDASLRLRRAELIQELCAPLLIIDSQGDGTRKQILKLHHKTVEDFFLQDPADIKVGDHLRKFFKTKQEIDTELGLHCLTYLSYQRYTKYLDLNQILNEKPQEHAFLRYAATYWFQHLLSVDNGPTAEVVTATRLFLKSKALLTCLEVQGRVSPYLFGRYASLRRNGSYKIGIRGAGWKGNDAFGVPLPLWLDWHSTEMQLLDRSLCCFLDEWREVLSTCAGGLYACSPLTRVENGCYLTPLSKTKPLKVEYLDEKLDMSSVSRISQIQITPGKPLWATVLYHLKASPPSEFTRLRIPLFSTKLKAIQSSVSLPVVDGEEGGGGSYVLMESVEGDEVSLEAWSVDQGGLALRRTTRSESELVKLPLAMHISPSLRKREGQEIVVAPVICSATNSAIKIFRVMWRRRYPMPDEPHESDDELDSSVEGSESDKASDGGDSSDDDSNDDDDDDDNDDDGGGGDDSDEDDEDAVSNDDESDDGASSATSNTRSDDGHADPETTSVTSVEESAEEGRCTDSLLVVAPGRRPRWMGSWRSQANGWTNINGAAHPYLPILAVTHTALKLEILNLESGEQQTRNLPELADLQETPAASTRELRFSPCGNYLHFLMISFKGDGYGTKCHVKLSTFDFNSEGNNDDTLVRGFQARSCSYWFGERPNNIAPPLALTFWNDDAVVVALPPLTCDPKILKISLPRGRRGGGSDSGHSRLEAEAEEATDDAAILTVSQPIFFPSTITQRCSQLIYRAGSGDGDDDYLYLSLGALTRTPTSDLTDINSAKPPVVLRWKIASGTGWQSCDAEMRQASACTDQHTTMMTRLRGTYTDESKSFGVPIRGGLNWSRKGFLSCS